MPASLSCAAKLARKKATQENRRQYWVHENFVWGQGDEWRLRTNYRKCVLQSCGWIDSWSRGRMNLKRVRWTSLYNGEGLCRVTFPLCRLARALFVERSSLV